MSTYCGLVIQQNQNTKKKIIQLPKIDGHYGLKNLYCFISLENPKKDETITIKSSVPVNTIKIDIILERGNKPNKYIQLTNDELISQYNNVKLMTFHIFTSQMFDSNPFQIEIFQKKKKLSVTTYLAISLIFISIIFCVICSVICTKRIIEKSNQRRRTFTQTTTQNQTENINIETKKELKKKIKTLLENDLKGMKYGSNEEKNEKICTICLEEFKTEDIVSVTKCQHLFHFKCISKWLNDNSTNLKCPNCNTNFIVNLESRPSTLSVNNHGGVQIYSSSRVLVNQNREVN